MTETKFMRMPALAQQVGLSRSQIYKLIGQGEFPQPIKIGQKVSAWVSCDIEDWMEEQIKRQPVVVSKLKGGVH